MEDSPKAVWYTCVENHSPYPVESVYCPYLGDLTRSDAAEWFKTFTLNYASAMEGNLWPTVDMNEEDPKQETEPTSENTELPNLLAKIQSDPELRRQLLQNLLLGAVGAERSA